MCHKQSLNLIFFRHNISVCGISTDADSRPLSCMKKCTEFMLHLDPKELITKKFMNDTDWSYIQDHLHLFTKIRNRILMPSVHLPMGSTQASVSHLKILIETVPKEIHGLVRSDISPDDRQNFISLQKCYNERCLSALEKYVPGSDGTIMYLNLCREMHSVYNEPNLEPIERIRRMWHSTYFYRAWRKWTEKNYKLKSNFITSVSYFCIELNAYGLIHLIQKLRNAGTPELFLPIHFSSQTCEETFRLLRSMTTIYWTRINFSLLELFHMIGRLEISNDIAYNKLAGNVNFPRIQKRDDKCCIYDLPSNEEMIKVLEEAKLSALSDAAQLGIHINPNEICTSGLPQCKKKTKSSETNMMADPADEMEEFILISDDENDDEESNDVGSTCDYNQGLEEENLSTAFLQTNSAHTRENTASKFVEITNTDGTARTVLKSSVIWAFTESKGKLSKDRLSRVQSPRTTPTTPRKRRLNDNSQANEPNSKKQKRNTTFSHANEVSIGDWCLFKNSNNTSDIIDDIDSSLVLGMVLGFKYIKGKSEKEKQYSLESVPSSSENTSNRGIEVLATWKKVDLNFIVHNIFGKSSFFIDINNYIGTVIVDRDDQKNVKLNLSPDEQKEISLQYNEKE